jgi:HK97 gp10 family phage protein
VEQNAKQTVFAIGLKKAKWYLRFFEFGTQPQEVTSKKGYFVFEGEAGLVITKTIQHKGMAAQPFLKPAITEGAEKVTKMMGHVFRDTILRFTK